MTLRSTRRLYATLIVSVFVFSLTILASVQPAVGQTTGSATLRGTVKDPQGAIIRGATVTLVNDRTKDERSTKTSEDGTYTFTALSPGAYVMKVELQGFKTSVRTDLADRDQRYAGHRRHDGSRPAHRNRHGHRRCRITANRNRCARKHDLGSTDR